MGRLAVFSVHQFTNKWHVFNAIFIITRLLVVCSCVEHKIWFPQPWIEELSNADKINLSNFSLSWSTCLLDFSTVRLFSVPWGASCECCVLSCSSRVCLCPINYGLQAARPLCPWESPAENTGVGCCALIQGWLLYHLLTLCSSSAVFMDWASISSLLLLLLLSHFSPLWLCATP